MFPSIWLHSPSDVDYHFSHVSARSINPFSVLVTITHSVSDFSRLSFSVILAQKYIYICVCVCLFVWFSLNTPSCRRACVCVWAELRPPVGRAGSALLPGCCLRSTQAFRHSPSLADPDSPSTEQASPCPHTPAPPQLRTHTHTQKSLGFRLHIKKRPVHILLMPAV